MIQQSFEMTGMALVVIGCAITLFGNLWMLLAVFRTGLLWGLAYLLLPFIGLIWLVLHWEEGRRPFFCMLIGGGIIVMGGALLFYNSNAPQANF